MAANLRGALRLLAALAVLGVWVLAEWMLFTVLDSVWIFLGVVALGGFALVALTAFLYRDPMLEAAEIPVEE